jgi:hypothetical protein
MGRGSWGVMGRGSWGGHGEGVMGGSWGGGHLVMGGDEGVTGRGSWGGGYLVMGGDEGVTGRGSRGGGHGEGAAGGSWGHGKGVTGKWIPWGREVDMERVKVTGGEGKGNFTLTPLPHPPKQRQQAIPIILPAQQKVVMQGVMHPFSHYKTSQGYSHV